MPIVFMNVANMARPSGQAKSQLASAQCEAHTRNNNSAPYGCQALRGEDRAGRVPQFFALLPLN